MLQTLIFWRISFSGGIELVFWKHLNSSFFDELFRLKLLGAIQNNFWKLLGGSQQWEDKLIVGQIGVRLEHRRNEFYSHLHRSVSSFRDSRSESQLVGTSRERPKSVPRSRQKSLTGDVALVLHVENLKKTSFKKSHSAEKSNGGPFQTCKTFMLSSNS